MKDTHGIEPAVVDITEAAVERHLADADEYNADAVLIRALRSALTARDRYGIPEVLAYLGERVAWLDMERRSGGDYQYLTLKLEECRYIAQCIKDASERLAKETTT